MNLSRKTVQKSLILAAALAAVAALSLLGVGCPIYHFLGFPCPGCGMTRAVLCLLHLDFAGAWSFHPMVFALPYLFALFWRDGKVFSNRALNAAVFALVALGFLLWYFYRLFCLQ